MPFNMRSQPVSEQFFWVQILMCAPVYVHGAHVPVLFAFTGSHQTDQTDRTEPVTVTCPQQTDSTGATIQPVIDPAHCGDRTNQVSELRSWC